MNVIPTNILGAMQAVKRGWYVFPIDPQSKAPKWRWSEQRTNSIAGVVAWWTNHPHDNVGIATKPSRLVIIDLDVGHTRLNVLGESYSNGVAAFASVMQRAGIEIPPTYTVSTPSGGLHLYFQAPEEGEIPNRPLLGAGGLMDVRASGGDHGGYVLAGGSATLNGREYRVVYDIDPVDLPAGLLRMLTPKPRPAKPPATKYDQPDQDFDQLLSWLAMVPEGGRNNALHWAACVLAEGEVSYEDALEILLPVYPNSGKTEQTVKSAYRHVKGGTE